MIGLSEQSRALDSLLMWYIMDYMYTYAHLVLSWSSRLKFHD
jgi:hypothetical protein